MGADTRVEPPVLPAWAELSRALRTACGLAQADWAEWLEVSRKTVQRWERGEAVPNDRVEARLLAFCAEKEVFGRIARGALQIGVADERELRDVLALARTVHGTERSSVPRPDGPIGRSIELATVRELMARWRLVTVVGPGGVGKTTLATAAAGDDGVLVRLDTIQDPDLVPGVIAEALDVHAQRGGSIRDRLVRILRDRPCLLVLDNFEHLLVAAPVVSDLLASCPELRVLATSRAPLGLSDEMVFRLAPLAWDGPDAAAVALFVERAREADPTGVVDGGDRDLVRSVCERLDGLPLAIELAAARLRHISLADLAARIDRALAVLGRSPHADSTRHRSLGDTIAWSVDLLDASQRVLFVRLSSFVDGATLDAIEAVGDDSVIDDLGALVDHSLVIRAGARYRMLETVRDYAGQVETAGTDRDSHGAAFFQWALDFAARQAGRSRGPGQQAALSETSGEYANLRAALSALTESGDDRAVRLAVSLCPFWDGRSMLHEARRCLEQAVALPGLDPLTASTARVWIGYFAAHQGDLAVAARMGQAALEVFSAADVQAGVGYARLVLGYVAAEEQQLEVATNEWLASEAALRSAGDRWGLIRPLNNLGELERARGDLSASSRRHEEALALCRELEETASLPSILSAIAQLALDSGDTVRAIAAADEALDVASRFENLIGQATALEALARVSFESGDVEAATEIWARADGLRGSLGLPIEARDRERYQRQLAEARAHLGDEQFTAVWQRGRPIPRDFQGSGGS